MMRQSLIAATVLLAACIAHAGPYDYTVTKDITWMGGGVFSRLDLSLDGGQTWPIPIAYGIPTGEPHTSYRWVCKVTPAMWTEHARIGIRDLWYKDRTDIPQVTSNNWWLATTGAWGDYSDGDFTIAGLRILAPTNGQHITLPGMINVSWHEAGATFVDIGISTNGGYSYANYRHTASTTPTNSTGIAWLAAYTGPMSIVVQASNMTNLFDVVTVEVVAP